MVFVSFLLSFLGTQKLLLVGSLEDVDPNQGLAFHVCTLKHWNISFVIWLDFCPCDEALIYSNFNWVQLGHEVLELISYIYSIFHKVEVWFASLFYLLAFISKF